MNGQFDWRIFNNSKYNFVAKYLTFVKICNYQLSKTIKNIKICIVTEKYMSIKKSISIWQSFEARPTKIKILMLDKKCLKIRNFGIF